MSHRVLLHPEYDRQVHHQDLTIEKPRPLTRLFNSTPFTEKDIADIPDDLPVDQLDA